MPTTGTASYSGIVAGTAKTPASGYLNAGVYDVTGTSLLTANFANATLTTSMTFSGKPIAGISQLVLGVPATTVSGTGRIGSSGFPTGISAGGPAGTFYGTFDGGLNGVGSFSGRFYGPGAREFGYNFMVSVNSIQAAGIAIGKK
jgi:hypothetical protein